MTRPCRCPLGCFQAALPHSDFCRYCQGDAPKGAQDTANAGTPVLRDLRRDAAGVGHAVTPDRQGEGRAQALPSPVPLR